jgi:CubicO group peptidase (beta-lactamase class C family)
MKRLRPLLVPALCVSAILGKHAAAQPTSSLASNDPAIERHIQNIVTNLLPPVLIKGQPTPKMTLSERMEELHIPGVSIAYIHDGKVGWARGFGVTKIGGPVVTPQTVFEGASLSKPVTAMAVLHLVQTGKLDLDTDVNGYLKSWKIPDNEFTAQKKVTLRALLSHSAGMPELGYPGYVRGTPIPTVLQVLDGQSPATTPPIRVGAIPGTIGKYSNAGYIVVQQLLEDVTGEKFSDLTREIVFTPAEMRRSTFEQDLPKDISADAAVPHDNKGDPQSGGAHVFPELAAGGLWTTPTDLGLLTIEIQNSLAGKSDRILSKAMTAEMLKPLFNNYGLGMGIEGNPRHPYMTYGGSVPGFRTTLLAYENGDGIFTMENSDNGYNLAFDIQRTVAHEYGWPDFQPGEHILADLDTKTKQSFVGKYQLTPNSVMNVTLEGDQLFTQNNNQAKRALYPESPTQVFFKDFDAEILFQLSSDGQARSATIRQDGQDRVAPRID